MSETQEVGRKHPSFRYPVLKNPTGRVQFCIDRAEAVTIDKIGDVRRGQVLAVKNANFARGLVASRSFAHCAADTPLGVTEAEEPSAEAPAEGSAVDTPRARGFFTQDEVRGVVTDVMLKNPESFGLLPDGVDDVDQK